MALREIFVDTQYWVATTTPGDPWASAAHRFVLMPGVRMVTTDEVIAEFLGFVCQTRARRAAGRLARALLTSQSIHVVPQSRLSLLRALDLYDARPDKGYSLVDCVSMVTMREMGIREVLSADHHFEQEGFELLLRRQ